MKGLELSRRFFDEVVFALIKRDLPECVPHISAGLDGGSQCHGNDDEISRDHGWGAGLIIWMDQENHDRFLEPLANVMKKLPQEYLGYPTGWNICKIAEYMRFIVGCESAPASDIDWLHIPEESLFEITHRPVFYDGPGEVSKLFQQFERYPEDVWKQRLRACILWLWEWGVKHYCRAERRGDVVTASAYWSRFVTYAMKIAFLLNHSYAPYHKWLYREFTKLPEAAPEVAPLIEQGYTQTREKKDLILRILDIYSQEFEKLGYHSSTLTPEKRQTVAYPDQYEFYSYMEDVRRSIENEEIRKLGCIEVLLPPWKSTWTWIQPLK